MLAGEGACKLKRYLFISRFFSPVQGIAGSSNENSYISIIQIKGVHNAIDMLGTRKYSGGYCTE